MFFYVACELTILHAFFVNVAELPPRSYDSHIDTMKNSQQTKKTYSRMTEGKIVARNCGCAVRGARAGTVSYKLLRVFFVVF